MPLVNGCPTEPKLTVRLENLGCAMVADKEPLPVAALDPKAATQAGQPHIRLGVWSVVSVPVMTTLKIRYSATIA